MMRNLRDICFIFCAIYRKNDICLKFNDKYIRAKRMVAPVPLDSCPAREPLRMALAGATRRCFALLGAFPARRDEALRGALGVGGGGRVRVNWSGGLRLLVREGLCAVLDAALL